MTVVTNSRGPDTGSSGPASLRPKQGRAALRRLPWLAAPALACVLIFFVFPVLYTLSQSATDFRPPQTGGLDNYRWFFADLVSTKIVVRTLLAGVMVTAACLLIGYPYAYLMTVTKGPLRTFLLAAVLLQICAPPVAQIFAWVVLLQDNGPVDSAASALGLPRLQLLGTLTGALLAMIQQMLPYMILPLFAIMRGIDRTLLLAARTLGARPLDAFARVYIPMSMPGVWAGSLMVFVISLGFYITPSVLGSPRHMLLSQFLVTQINTLLAWGRGGAIAAIMLLLTVLLLFLGRRFLRASSSSPFDLTDS